MNRRRPIGADVIDASRQLVGIAINTPLLRSETLDMRTGAKVFIKCENLQRSGAFKFRGAYNCLSRLNRSAFPGGVVAYSTGNHGVAVASVGRILGIQTTIVVPLDAPAVKLSLARAQGAEVVLYDRQKESREEIAARIAGEHPVAVIPPGDDPFVIAGQGTAVLEAFQTLASTEVDAVLVPCGGGGLAAGTCLAVEAFGSKAEVWAVEPAQFDDTRQSLISGRREKNTRIDGSICDALLAPTPAELPFAINKENLASVLVADDAQVLDAIRFAYEELRIVVEPGGAIALAALLANPGVLRDKTVVVLVSGGNVDPAVFAKALQQTPTDCAGGRAGILHNPPSRVTSSPRLTQGMPTIMSHRPSSDSRPTRISDLELPERAPIAGASARRADIALLAKAPADYLDTTHFDTIRFPPPPWAAEHFARAAGDGALAYTGYRGNRDVISEVTQSISAFLNLPLDPERNVILTPGTQAGLFASLASLIEDGGRVALVDPDYLFTARMLRFFGAEIGYIPLRLMTDGLSLDLDALETEFKDKGARYFVFSHPNNPTGAVFSGKTIADIAQLVERYDVTVVVDELYSRLLHDDRPFPHLAVEAGMLARTATLLGPSKTESLSGYRLGVVVAPGELVDRIENVLSIMSLRAPAYAQHILLPWLRDDHDWLANRIQEFTALRRLTIQRLCRLPWLKLDPQAGTAYAWPDVSALQLPDPVVAEALLCEAGVLVSPGYQFGPGAGGHFRVCYARDEATWAAALDRITMVLEKLAEPRGLPGGLK